jgi:hypothetical protein
MVFFQAENTILTPQIDWLNCLAYSYVVQSPKTRFLGIHD